jgi:cystathionine beta-lyase/cystathionine gamma-synthase
MIWPWRRWASGGTLVAFEVAGGKEAAFRFMNALEIAKISNNLGDAKTIATHPATTTHQRLPQDQKDKLGITPGLIRLSVGLEDAGDLIADLRQALARSDWADLRRSAGHVGFGRKLRAECHSHVIGECLY